ncbi:MAG: hypothetical protein ACXWQR_24325, partial [Ktedonobacterales bacterium]
MIPDYPSIKREKLKPEGHSAWIESLIEPAIVVGSTLMSAIAAYVLAVDEITRILDGHGTMFDWFITVLCVGMGFLVDMAIIVSATRYKMHAVRNDHRERIWKRLAIAVLIVGLASETATLFYFFVSMSPASFPPQLVEWANRLHAALGVSRAFLPPVVIAYFAAGVLPVMLDRSDRNRKIIAATSNNIMLLINRLSEVYETDDKAEQLRALGGQMALATYAEYDRTDKTNEQEQMKRDSKLLTLLAGIHRLDWSAIGADVAPELTPPTPPHGGVPAPAPAAPDMGLNPLASEEVRTIVQSMPEPAATSGRLYVVKDAPKGRRRNAPGRRTKKGKRDTSSVKKLADAVWHPGMTVSEMMEETAKIN